MEEHAPEQESRQFPAQAANTGWLRGWFPAFMSELPSSVRSAVVPDGLAVWPLGGQDGGQHLEVAQPCGLMHPSAKRGGGQWSLQTLPTKESLPAPGGGQGSAEHSLTFEVVKDPMRFCHSPGHNVFFWVNTMFYGGPSRT